MKKILKTEINVYTKDGKWFCFAETEEEAKKIVNRAKPGNRFYKVETVERTVYDNFEEACEAWAAEHAAMNDEKIWCHDKW